VTCKEALEGYEYFEPGTCSLFPTWPEYRTGEIAMLLTITIVVLLLPKVLGMVLVLCQRAQRRAFGGSARILGSVLLEQLFSMLLAPAMMVFHSTFVVRTLFGHVVRWDAQPRDDRGISFREAFARMKWHIALGVAWGAVILAFAPAFIWWMAPVIAGLLAGVPMTMLTSRADLGHKARERGLFLTPEETDTPVELLGIEAVNTPEYHEPPDAQHEPVPAQSPLRMESGPLDRYSFRDAVTRKQRRARQRDEAARHAVH
jgi:membrane glycosyltransferase